MNSRDYESLLTKVRDQAAGMSDSERAKAGVRLVEALRNTKAVGKEGCGSSDRAPELRKAGLAIKAADLFLGRVPEAERVEVAQGLALESGVLSIGVGLGVVSWSSFWEVVDVILNYLANIGKAGMAPMGSITAIAITVYYFLNPPNPTGCNPTRVDLWRHCYVGCKISFWVPGGAPLSASLAVLQEIAYLFGLGTADIDDIIETLSGSWNCGYFESCNDCCCDKDH